MQTCTPLYKYIITDLWRHTDQTSGVTTWQTPIWHHKWASALTQTQILQWPWMIRGYKLATHLLTLLQNIGSTMFSQALIEKLNCFFVLLLFEVRVADASQSPTEETRTTCHISSQRPRNNVLRNTVSIWRWLKKDNLHFSHDTL